ncbi:hypothetical protein [Hahella sp. NBU794]|uniref:hypothetical protein n=1 Tax=Hahella sp. NBU794 TaxID=3422590 RepID=UPI003D6FBC7D
MKHERNTKTITLTTIIALLAGAVLFSPFWMFLLVLEFNSNPALNKTFYSYPYRITKTLSDDNSYRKAFEAYSRWICDNHPKCAIDKSAQEKDNPKL